MSMHWKDLSSAQKVSEVIAAHPQTIGTASAIASHLSIKFEVEITRNAIIGLYHRNAAALEHIPMSGAGNLPGKTTSKQTKPLVGRNNKAKTPIKPAKVVEVAKIEQAVAAPVVAKPLFLKLFELERSDCRWPVAGEKADTLFCGHKIIAGCSYCEGHHRMSRGKGTIAERNADSLLKVA